MQSQMRRDNARLAFKYFAFYNIRHLIQAPSTRMPHLDPLGDLEVFVSTTYTRIPAYNFLLIKTISKSN